MSISAKDVLRLIESKNLENIDIFIDEPSGVMRLSNSVYELEVIINQKWIGYDFKIRKHVLGRVVGSFVDTDLYPLDTDPEITREIYDEVYFFVKVSCRISYTLD